MPNNTVNLNGFLSVEEVKSGFVEHRQPTTLIRGWIDTDPDLKSGRHPFVASGTPAQVILENARLASAADPAQGDLYTRFGVTLRSKLVSMPARSFLEIKHISFFDLSNPICLTRNLFSHFAANSVTLQGYLEIQVKDPIWRHIDGISDRSLAGCIHTDADCAGGKHPLMISGKLAELLVAQFAATKECAALSCPATVGGRLLTVDSTIYVQAAYLSIQKEAPQYPTLNQYEPSRASMGMTN